MGKESRSKVGLWSTPQKALKVGAHMERNGVRPSDFTRMALVTFREAGLGVLETDAGVKGEVKKGREERITRNNKWWNLGPGSGSWTVPSALPHYKKFWNSAGSSS